MTTFDSTPGDTWCMVAYSEHTDIQNTVTQNMGWQMH